MKIENHTLTKIDIGRSVVYFERGGTKLCRGRIKSWNDTFVFVVFYCNDNWDDYQNYTGQACCPEDLKWADYVLWGLIKERGRK